jgi:hypothetical protein
LFALLWALVAFAAEAWFVESPPTSERADLAAFEVAADGAGVPVRVVRRFRLGKGWEWVALAEGFADEAAAEAAARKLAKEAGASVTVVRSGAKGTGRRSEAAVSAPGPTPAQPSGAADLVARAVAAHGEKEGGAAALSRAPAVHFSFDREIADGGGRIHASHDYWREGPSRRLAVDVDGAGVDSLAVATPKGAWIQAKGTVAARDIGVVINQVDAFAPEVVLGVVLDVPTLLGSGEGLLILEGAESGVRVGRGEDPAQPGLAFADIDPATGRLALVRYVTSGGPLLFHCEDWAEAVDGVLYPRSLVVERPDGTREAVHVRALDVAEHAPGGSFASP